MYLALSAQRSTSETIDTLSPELNLHGSMRSDFTRLSNGPESLATGYGHRQLPTSNPGRENWTMSRVIMTTEVPTLPRPDTKALIELYHQRRNESFRHLTFVTICNSNKSSVYVQ